MDKLFALQNNHAEITFDFIDQQVYSICAIVRSGDEFPVEEVPELSDKVEDIKKSTKKAASNKTPDGKVGSCGFTDSQLKQMFDKDADNPAKLGDGTLVRSIMKDDNGKTVTKSMFKNGGKDYDKDGLNNNKELVIERSREKYVWILKSNPVKRDTDGDGMEDLLDNVPINSKVHSFLIYETQKNDEDLKLFGFKQRPEDYKYADKSQTELRNMEWINWNDFFLTNDDTYLDCFKTLIKMFSMGDMQQVGLDMVDHFVNGSGADYHNEVLSKEIEKHKNTEKYVNNITKIINNQIMIANGDLSWLNYEKMDRENSLMVKIMKENVKQPIYNDYFSGLGICVDGLYGNQIEITSYQFDGNNYRYTVHFTMYDIFGLDSTDITDNLNFAPPFGVLAGFRAWYILQHYDKYNGKYQPFISYMEFDKTVKGKLQ